MSEKCQYRKSPSPHSITSSARTSIEGSTVRPIALAVLRLMIRSNLGAVSKSAVRRAGPPTAPWPPSSGSELDINERDSDFHAAARISRLIRF
jgi:hypothetical protein